jgi:RNA 2',3'-cyclic 3'-phosphodiesterase
MTIRAFFAIDLSKQLKEILGQTISDLKKQMDTHPIRWVNPQDLHLTLQFLKQLAIKDIQHLVEKIHLELYAMPTFNLQIGHVELFSTAHHINIISLQAEPHGILTALSTMIGQGINAAGYASETRPFRAHITLGRITNTSSFTLPEISKPILEKSFTNEITLFQSNPTPTESNYTCLAKIKLRD